jgi:hypothetical protein
MALLPVVAGGLGAVALVFNSTASPTSGALERVTSLHAAGWLLATSSAYLLDDLTLDVDLSLPNQLRSIIGARIAISTGLWLPMAFAVVSIANLRLSGIDALPKWLFLVEMAVMYVAALAIAINVYMFRGQPRVHMGLSSALTAAGLIGAFFLVPWGEKPWIELSRTGEWRGQPMVLVFVGVVAAITAAQLDSPRHRWREVLSRMRNGI